MANENLKPIPINKGLFLDADPSEISATEYATRLLNLMLSKSGANVDRPDLSTFAETGRVSGIQGLYYFADYLLAVSKERRVYKISQAGVVTDISGGATLAGTSRPVFANDGAYAAIAGGQTPKRWSGSGNISDMAGSPPDLRFIGYLDGYWIGFIADSQRVEIAGPTAAARLVWNGDFFEAEALPDGILAQAIYQREYYAIGEESLEVFQNFGDNEEPFQRTFCIDRGTGAGAIHSAVFANNTLFFLDGERHFVKLDGRTPVYISDQLDEVLKDPDFVVTDCFGFKVEIKGFYLIVWVFPTEGRSFAYDYRTGEWSEWNAFIDGVEARIKIDSHFYVKPWAKHFVGDPDTGTIYELTRAAKGTQASPLRRVRETGFYDHGTGLRKRSRALVFHVKRGLSTPGADEEFFEVQVNDDGEGWSDPVQVGLGYPGEKNEPIIVDELQGIYRKRQLRILTTAQVEFNLSKIEEDVEVIG